MPDDDWTENAAYNPHCIGKHLTDCQTTAVLLQFPGLLTAV